MREVCIALLAVEAAEHLVCAVHKVRELARELMRQPQLEQQPRATPKNTRRKPVSTSN